MNLERMHNYIGVRVYMKINQYEDVLIEISWYFTNFFLLVYAGYWIIIFGQFYVITCTD